MPPADDLPALVPPALAALGNSPEDIARSLALAGVRGKRQACCACPLVVWLGRRFPAWQFHLRGGGLVASRTSGHGPAVSLTVPDPCKLFARRFDEGAFPEVELSGKGGAA